MDEPLRLVIDTNVLLSRALWPRSVPARSVLHATTIGKLLISDATMAELADVLSRPKFDAYLRIDERQEFVGSAE